MRGDATRYQQYLRSRHWRRRRASFAENHPKVCQCGSRERIQLHHKTYVRLGAERDEDLVWLCERCHALVEQLIDEGQLDRALTGFFSAARAKPVEVKEFVPAHLRGAARDRDGRLCVANPGWRRNQMQGMGT